MVELMEPKGLFLIFIQQELFIGIRLKKVS